MSELTSIRIDKFLWSVRLYKTRTIATEACKSKHVLLNDMPVKPSSTVKTGDTLEIKSPPIIRTFKVIALLRNRVSAKLVADYITETTPQVEFDKLRIAKETTTFRDKGTGRPTKKDRRDIDKFNPYL